MRFAPIHVKINALLLLLWIVMITVLSLSPADGFQKFQFFAHFDKLAHFLFYFGFAVLAFRLLFYTTTGSMLRLSVVSATLPIVYSGFIELAQEYLVSYRSAEFLDFLMNILGAIAAVYIYRIVIRYGFRKFYMR